MITTPAAPSSPRPPSATQRATPADDAQQQHGTAQAGEQPQAAAFDAVLQHAVEAVRDDGGNGSDEGDERDVGGGAGTQVAVSARAVAAGGPVDVHDGEDDAPEGGDESDLAERMCGMSGMV